jgi:hypothetical protein
VLHEELAAMFTDRASIKFYGAAIQRKENAERLSMFADNLTRVKIGKVGADDAQSIEFAVLREISLVVDHSVPYFSKCVYFGITEIDAMLLQQHQQSNQYSTAQYM